MATVLFLAHRLPYPPNKGDKVRSYHLLKHLAKNHRVLLGTFVDDPDDLQHVDHLRNMCAEVHVSRLHPPAARLRSLKGLLTNEALSLAYYHDADLAQWVEGVKQRADLDAVVVFSSSMLPYSKGVKAPMVVDFADVDSDKWAEYGRTHRWPLSWVYSREGRKLRDTERDGGARARWSLFATSVEADLFRAMAPECAQRVAVLNNGVDSVYYAPQTERASPFAKGERALVFIGTMDHWPNVDAALWTAQSMLPVLRQRFPGLRLYVVGRNPTPALLALHGDAVQITGTVADVRPYVQHASAVVAPIRLARGIQNKVLEAMAMGRPVVTSKRCAAALDTTTNQCLLSAEEASDYVREITGLLESPTRAEAIGRAAREHVLTHFSWDARLAELDQYLPAAFRQPAGPGHKP
jgi:polysaccharide biosynthesis protein PslH